MYRNAPNKNDRSNFARVYTSKPAALQKCCFLTNLSHGTFENPFLSGLMLYARRNLSH
jgi:hypothetical protein